MYAFSCAGVRLVLALGLAGAVIGLLVAQATPKVYSAFAVFHPYREPSDCVGPPARVSWPARLLQSVDEAAVQLGLPDPDLGGPASKMLRLIGTWQRLSQANRPLPAYVRYYADGHYAWWPAIEPKFSVNGVTYGHYRVEKSPALGWSDLIEGNSTHRGLSVVPCFLIKGNRMTMAGDDLQEGFIRVPDREPGN